MSNTVKVQSVIYQGERYMSFSNVIEVLMLCRDQAPSEETKKYLQSIIDNLTTMQFVK